MILQQHVKEVWKNYLVKNFENFFFDQKCSQIIFCGKTIFYSKKILVSFSHKSVFMWTVTRSYRDDISEISMTYAMTYHMSSRYVITYIIKAHLDRWKYRICHHDMSSSICHCICHYGYMSSWYVIKQRTGYVIGIRHQDMS